MAVRGVSGDGVSVVRCLLGRWTLVDISATFQNKGMLMRKLQHVLVLSLGDL